MEKFEGFFKVRKNIIFERARFNRRNQLEGETAEKYITELYRLVDGCEYAGLKVEMIRDRLVVGILYQELSEKLQLEPDLTAKPTVHKMRSKCTQQRGKMPSYKCSLLHLQNERSLFL